MGERKRLHKEAVMAGMEEPVRNDGRDKKGWRYTLTRWGRRTKKSDKLFKQRKPIK